MSVIGNSDLSGAGGNRPLSGSALAAGAAPAGAPWSGGGGQPSTATVDAEPTHLWLILVVIAIAQLMIVLDATIMNIALPSAQRALHFSLADRQWIVTAYALAFGSLLLFGGKLSDLFGRKNTFIAGLFGFAAASTVGGAATSFAMLASARAIQGAFAALLAPSALSLLATTFTEEGDRRKAFAVYGAVAGAGGAVGLVLGGLLTEYLSWRWCLYVNDIFAAVAVFGAIILIGQQVSWGRPRLDVPGALLVSGGMFSIVYGFSNAATHRWSTPSTWGFLVAGAALLLLFAFRQLQTQDPLLPPRIVANRNRAGAYLATLIGGAGMFGILLFLNYYMQQNLGYSPLRTGLAFLPMVGGVMIVGNIANVGLMPRIGPKLLVGFGMLLGGASAALLARLGLHANYASDILPPVLIAGVGLGFIFAPVADTGTSGVPPRDTGVASATLNTGNQLGGSIGTSLLNTIFAGAITTYIAAQVRSAGFVHGHPTQRLVDQAVVHSYHVTFWWVAAIWGAGGLICGALLRFGPLPNIDEPSGIATAPDRQAPAPSAAASALAPAARCEGVRL